MPGGTTTTATGDHRHEAHIIRTSDGVAHITAADLGSVAFGQGYACAADHLPTIADQVLKVRSERSRHFGRGVGDRHLHGDLGYLGLGVRARAERMAVTQPAEIIEAVEGYAAGVNAWLAEHGTGDLPGWCRDAAWVRPVSAIDLFTVYCDLAVMASGRNLVEYIGAAVPPNEPQPPAPPTDAIAEPGLSSNGWALGRAKTASGGGMVMANPHFPWYGEARFWECHLTVPGDLDVYGVSLVGVPFVQMGFTDGLAWTHTFSRGHRFIVGKLDLLPDRPTAYRHGDAEREMSATVHHVEVLGDDGTVDVLERTLWSSHLGPMLNLPFLGWSEPIGFTYRDANIENERFLAQGLAMDRSHSIDDLRDAVATHQGLPWVNTLAADSRGCAWYADSSTTPDLSEEAQREYEQNLDTDPVTALLATLRVAMVDGSDPRFDWIDDPDAKVPGTVPFDRLPQVETEGEVFNANDPYWLVAADHQLPEHSVFCGRYRSEVSPRTRMNALTLAGEGPVRPSGDDGRFTAADLEAAVLGNHSLLAELLLDDVLARLDGVTEVEVDGVTTDVDAAVRALASWNRRFDLDSRGAVVWRELLAGFTEEQLRDAGPLWAEPYDPDDPVRTPRGLAPVPPGGPDPLAHNLARAVRALDTAGVAVDAPLGDVQYNDRSGRRIPLHGANEVEGILNVIAPVGALNRSDLEPIPEPPPGIAGRTERTGLRQGGYPVIYGSSFVMVCEQTPDGPSARGVLAYGQSGDDRSPLHAAGTDAFSRKELRPLRFRQDQIDDDEGRVSRVVTG